MSTAQLHSLAQLKPAQRGTITDIDASQSVSQRLTMLGVLPGVSIEMVREAPLGDPITFAVNGQYFSLRRDDAQFVTVRL